MITAELKQLLEKFYEGATTELEEKELKLLLDQENLPEEFHHDLEYFRSMESLKNESASASFENELMEKISSEGQGRTIRFWPLGISSVAATIAIFLAIWFGTDLLSSKQVYGTITDPHIAFSQSQKILEEVSKNLDKGLKPAKKTVDKVEKNVEKTGEVSKLNKALEKTKSLNKIDRASELLKSFNKVVVDYGKS